MLKKKVFYFILILIYILFLCKDYLIKNTTFNDLVSTSNTIKDNYYKEEYQEMSKLLNIQVNNIEIIYTKAIFRNIYDFYQSITINKGYSSGLKEGSIILNSEGVIGVLNKVNKNSSEVYLLTNPSINLSVKVNDSYGILTSKDNIVYVKNIKTTNTINIGDKVYTSGLTNIPGQILIGEVKNVKTNDLELEYILEITLSANLNNLKYLGVYP